MLLTLSTTHQPATDLGYLLHKNPANVNSVSLAFGTAHVFYPEASAERCTAALLLEVDPVGLVRRAGPAGEGFALQQYVNDRPYVACSLMSVALARVFGTALAGRCAKRPELVEQPLPLTAHLPVVPARGGMKSINDLFEPLGYMVEISAAGNQDAGEDEWSSGDYWNLTLRGESTVKRMLAHLYVLMPVLDNDKHYWISQEEVEKLLRHGEGWLGEHPRRDWIVERYLKRQRRLVNEALARLAPETDEDAEEAAGEAAAEPEMAAESPMRLNDLRMEAVTESLKSSGAASVLDMGCGEGRLMRRLLKEKQFTRIVGMDVAVRSLERARDRLNWDRLAPKQQARLELLHGSLMYRDRRLEGFDAAAAVEVIEHLDPARLKAFERVAFEFARPGCFVVTTPNIEYNVRFEGLAPGALRHRDHRFEWTRQEFAHWATQVAQTHGYGVKLRGVGPEDAEVGSPTQMAVFEVEGDRKAKRESQGDEQADDSGAAG